MGARITKYLIPSMQLTDKEKKIAQSAFADKELVALIEKIFTPDVDALEPSLEKMALSLDDAHYGQNMKALAIAKASFGIKMQQIKTMGGHSGEKGKPVAPR